MYLFDAGLKQIRSDPMHVAAFAGSGGKNRDRVFVIGPDGSVTAWILT